MARKEKDYEETEEYEDEEYDDEGDYEDDYYYDDYPRRNPLKPFVIALLVLLVLMAAVIGLLYTRLRTANDKITDLNATLEAARTEINSLLNERTSNSQPAQPAQPSEPAQPQDNQDAQVPEVTPEPEATPEPTPEVTPEPTAEPTPTPAPLLKDSVTDEDLNGIKRPDDGSWLEKPKAGVVTPYMLALHWGPSMNWNESNALRMDDKVETVAEQNGWRLVRNEKGVYGWCVANLIKDTE